MGLPFLDSSAAAHQGVWHADELGSAEAPVIGTGHAALDAQLPGGGWPVGAMTELLQTAPQDPIWPLLLPGLVQAVQARGGPVVLIGPPCEPFGASLAAHGLAPESLMWVRSDAPAARLWACEQALRCADVGAVLAWLPQARVGELRRLQLAAAQHDVLLFVCRPEAVAQSASPARLRLRIVRSAADAGQVELHILKRRGPPLAAPVMAPARSERMSALLAAARLRRKMRLQEEAGPVAADPATTVVRIDTWKKEGRHALDRLAVVA
ncbi:MAG: translesion DNA synthesis-associated protein ImuA [Variovorax sp.]|nr:translesion DNA synthesis-associated protein ImuA [Variovorax sp.]